MSRRRSEVLFYRAVTTFGMAAEAAIEQAGILSFAGKVVIDATNPLGFDDGGVHLAIGFDDSLGERVQRALPEARVGNDDSAKREVTEILRTFGWDIADLGGIEASRYLEPICMAWVVYGAGAGSWHHAFKLLR